MSSKSKPCLSETPCNKATPTTPKVIPKVAISKVNKTPSKLSGDSPSPLQNPRGSAERSPRTITPRSSNIGRPSPRVTIPPEKAQSRILKPSELQAHLTSAQDELKKTKEKLLLVEKEKAEALSELEEARKLANDANEKLQESVVAQKQAEESSEVEKFWAAELEENDGIEAVRKNEDKWQKECEEVGAQNTMDLTFLLSSTEEHQRIKQELAMVTDTKNQALIHADEATKIAEIHAEKVEILSAELIRLKGLLDSKSKIEASDNFDVTELKLELRSLKQELEIAKGFEKNLAQKRESCELLKSELNSVKEEVERFKGLDIILAQKEESCEQLKLEFESIRQELEKAKVLENFLCQKEESFISEIESLKQELIKAKTLEDRVFLGDESYEQLKTESVFLKLEIEKSKGFEELLVQKDASLQHLTWNLDSLKQELVKAKDLEEKLSKREANYEQLKSEADFLKHELAKPTGFKENLVQKDESLQQLKLELEFLKKELEKAINLEEKLFQREESFEQLSIELEASRIAESYARSVLEEWRDRVDELELQVEESSRLKKSMESVMKQLERNGDLLLAAECEINSHKEKVSSLEMALGKKKMDLEESDENLEKAREEASAATKENLALKSELKTLEEEKIQVLEKKKLASSIVQELLQEKQKLMNEIEALREEEEKSKRAMQSLASAMHEVSAEARELEEKLLSSESEHEGLANQIEDLDMMLKATNEKYESLLDDAKSEINHLKSTMDHSKLEFEYQIEDMRLVLKETDEKYVALLSDAKQEINQLKDTIEHLNNDLQNVNSEWVKKEVQLVNSLKTAENAKYETMLSDAKHNIDHLRTVIEQSKISKPEWQLKELESSAGRFKEVHMTDRTTDLNYGTMLDDAQDEIKHLSNMIEKSKVLSENTKHEWEKQQLQLMNAVNRLEEQKSSMEKEIMRLVNLLREKEEVARSEKEEGSQLRNTLKEEIFKATCLREALDEFQVEENTLKTDLQDRDRQLLNLARENEQLQALADVNVRKVKELSKLLEEATSREETRENGDLSDSEKDYDMLPRVVEFSEENGQAHRREDKPGQPESYSQAVTDEGLGKEKEEHSIADSEPKMMWESCKIDKNDFSMEREAEHESVDDDELDPKAETGEAFDQLNGIQPESDRTSESKEQQHKKKKPLYRKFGSLLKKGIGNQK
ncbi:hypothetical protein V2J09_009148 [Rumex salicifolius]